MLRDFILNHFSSLAEWIENSAVQILVALVPSLFLRIIIVRQPLPWWAAFLVAAVCQVVLLLTFYPLGTWTFNPESDLVLLVSFIVSFIILVV